MKNMIDIACVTVGGPGHLRRGGRARSAEWQERVARVLAEKLDTLFGSRGVCRTEVRPAVVGILVIADEHDVAKLRQMRMYAHGFLAALEFMSEMDAGSER